MHTYKKIIVHERASRDQAVLLAEQYMRMRGIGESAVDLIPTEVRHPCGPIRTNNEFNWVHTPGRVKWGVWMVRQAMAEIK